LLFELLARSADVWTIGRESHHVFARIPDMQPAATHLESGRLDASHASEGITGLLWAAWAEALRDCRGRRLADLELAREPRAITFLEKTPSNCLRVPFLKACFPDARFVFLYRDPRETIASLIEGWLEGERSGRFVTFRNLPDSARPAWCFILPPGWHALSRRPLAEIAAEQWRVANSVLLDDLSAIPRDDWTTVSYADLCLEPAATIHRLCSFMGVRPDAAAASLTSATLPVSATALTPPHDGKWRRHETEVRGLLPGVRAVVDRLARAASPS
jgi:hypothetical protein